MNISLLNALVAAHYNQIKLRFYLNKVFISKTTLSKDLSSSKTGFQLCDRISSTDPSLLYILIQYKNNLDKLIF